MPGSGIPARPPVTTAPRFDVASFRCFDPPYAAGLTPADVADVRGEGNTQQLPTVNTGVTEFRTADR